MRQDGSAGTEINAGGEEEAEEEESGGGYAALLGGLVSQLLSEAEMPPREVRGVSEEWMAGRLLRCSRVCAWAGFAMRCAALRTNEHSS